MREPFTEHTIVPVLRSDLISTVSTMSIYISCLFAVAAVADVAVEGWETCTTLSRGVGGVTELVSYNYKSTNVIIKLD